MKPTAKEAEFKRILLPLLFFLLLLFSCVASADIVYDFVSAFDHAVAKEGLQVQAKRAFAGGIGRPALLEIPANQGKAVVSYEVHLPPAPPEGYLILHFYYALADTATFDDKAHPADGGELELRLSGTTVFKQPVKTQRWREVALDVTRLAGQTIRFDFLAWPLENNNYDHLVWGSPQLFLLKGPPVPSGVLAKGCRLLSKGDVDFDLPAPSKDDWLIKLRCPVSGEGSLGVELQAKLDFSAGYLVVEYYVNLKMAQLEDAPLLQVAALDAQGKVLAESSGVTSPLLGSAAGQRLLALVPFNFGGKPFDHLSLSFTFTRLPDETDHATREVTVKTFKLFRETPTLKVRVLGASPAVAFPGDTATVRCLLQNAGSGNLDLGHKALLTLKLPSGLSVKSPTREITDLLAGEEKSVAWQVKLPESFEPGAWPLGLSVTLDGAEVARGATSLHVFQPSGWPSPLPAGSPPQLLQAGPLPATLLNDKLALSFVSESGACKAALLLRNFNGRFEVVGSLFPLAKVAYRDSAGNVAWLILPITKVVKTYRSGSKLTVLLAGEATDSLGLTWQLKFSLSLESGSDSLGFGLSATNDAPTELFAFFGPVLRAGDRSFGTAKRLACFPGLEYLLKDERSSSTYAVAPPASERLSPHPFKYTLPLVWVNAAHCSIGLQWNPHLDWIAGRAYPLVEFASPNFADGQDNHLMALFVPSLPERHTENRLLADSPLPWPEAATIRLAGRVFAESDDTGLAPLQRYLAHAQLPPPPAHTPSLLDEVRLALDTLTSTLWDERAAGWKLASGWAPKYDPEIAAALLAQGFTTGSDKLVQQAQTAIAHTTCPGLAVDLLVGPTAEALQRNRDYICSLLASQCPDGAWPFNPDKRRRVFGKPGDTASGLTADAAVRVLRYALVTLDPQAVKAGLKALDFLSTCLRPEGAQSWESPLHTPDLLAAAKCCEACLLGYRLTGEQRWLDQARLWALRGLPFVYLWQAPERPLMAYGTVPLFGATWFDVQSWFGVASPWVGLQYAESLLALAHYDDSLPWRRLAEGICRFAMALQATEPDSAKGLVPDAWDIVNAEKPYQFDLAPKRLLLLASALLGRPLQPDTRVLKAPFGLVSLTCRGLVLDFQADSDSTLTARLRRRGKYPETELLCGVPEPSQVFLQGRPVSKGPASETAPSWEYLPAFKALLLHVPPGRGPISFQCTFAPSGASNE